MKFYKIIFIFVLNNILFSQDNNYYSSYYGILETQKYYLNFFNFKDNNNNIFIFSEDNYSEEKPKITKKEDSLIIVNKEFTLKGIIKNNFYKGNYTKKNNKKDFKFTKINNINVKNYKKESNEFYSEKHKKIINIDFKECFILHDSKIIDKKLIRRINDKSHLNSIDQLLEANYLDFKTKIENQDLKIENITENDFIYNSCFFPVKENDDFTIYKHYIITKTKQNNINTITNTFYMYNKSKNEWIYGYDIFLYSKINELEKIINNYLRQEYKIPRKKNLNQAFKDKEIDYPFSNNNITYTDNFILDEKNITFYYNKKELTNDSYPISVFELKIPLKKLKKVLSENFLNKK